MLSNLQSFCSAGVFEPFQTANPVGIAVGFAGAILLCVLLFCLYDYLMRQEAKERNDIVNHLVQENKRKTNDTMWSVKISRAELEFDDPAQVLGQGTFGLVLLACYRGTNVAVKRVVPPRQPEDSQDGNELGMFDAEVHQNRTASIGLKSGITWSSVELSSTCESSDAPAELRQRNVVHDSQQLRQDFIEEMRHLSRLRHPCVTTLIGTKIPCLYTYRSLPSPLTTSPFPPLYFCTR